MSLFKKKFKKVEPQNVEVMPDGSVPIEPPILYSPQIKPPVPIQQPIPQQIPQQIAQPVQIYQEPLPKPNLTQERLNKKIEDMKVKIMVYQNVLEILEGI